MSSHRRTGLLAALLLVASGGAVVSTGGPASATADTVVIYGHCQSNRVNINHTITIHSDGSWEQKTRAHNSSITRRHVQADTYLVPYSAGGARAGSFTSAERTLGGGVFADDTKTWTSTGKNAGWIPWFEHLQGGGNAWTQCRVDSNWLSFTPPAYQPQNWQAQWI